MPLPAADLIKVLIGGAMGNENWSIGLWFNTTGIGAVTPSDMNNLASDCVGAWQTFWTAQLKAKNAAATTSGIARVSWYDAGVLTNTGFASAGPAAGTGTGPNPAYVARVITLLTDFAGRSYRGRLYLPWTGEAVSGSTFQWGSVATLLAAFKTFAQACETAILARMPTATTANFAVVGRTNGNVTNVHSLRIDGLPDTQHGRSRRLSAISTDSLAY